MPVEMETQLRMLGHRLERDVTHVSADEVLGRVGNTIVSVRGGQERIAPPATRMARRRWVTAAAVCLVAVLVGGLVFLTSSDPKGIGVTNQPGSTAGTVLMPDLLGLASEEAIDRLQQLGLAVVVMESNDPDGIFDTVVATDPPAGTDVLTGAQVRVTIANRPGTGGPLDFATTEQALPLWGHIAVSEPAATTFGYGLDYCDGGTATMRAAVDTTAGPEHSYYGTLCAFVTLTEPRPSSVTSCATITNGTHYARCQRRTDQTDSTGPGAHHMTTAKGDEASRIDLLPAATRSDEPQTFSASISAAISPTDQIDYQDDTIAVVVTQGDEEWKTRVLIELADATVDGWVDTPLLQSGLAYAAFQNRVDTIDIIGIVPDDITQVDIGGTVLEVTNNVWHHTASADERLDFVVRSADGRSAST